MPMLSDLYDSVYAVVAISAISALLACVAILILLFVAGIIWAPFGGAICARMARRKGLPAGRYSTAAWSYSAQFLIPWIYLVIALRGNPTNRATSRIDYIFIYALWTVIALGTFGVFWGAFIHVDGDYGPFGDYAKSGTGRMSTHIFSLLIAFAPIPANVFLFQKTLRDLRRKRREDRQAIQDPKSPPDCYALPHKAYTRPFSMTLLGSMLICLSWLIVTISYWGCGFGDGC